MSSLLRLKAMQPVSELSALSADLFIWSGYDPSVKAELSATALRIQAGWLFIDPIPLAQNLSFPWENQPIAGIVATNENHERAGRDYADRFTAPWFAHPKSQLDARPLTAHGHPFSDLSIIEIDGAPAGEIALYHSAAGGTLIVGDALIQMEPMGFALLPARYCRSQKTMRRSLRALLDFSFERILFAHGSPLTHHARARLAELLAPTE